MMIDVKCAPHCSLQLERRAAFILNHCGLKCGQCELALIQEVYYWQDRQVKTEGKQALKKRKQMQPPPLIIGKLQYSTFLV